MIYDKAIDILRSIIKDEATLIEARFDNKYFTRNRKMGFKQAVCMMLDMQDASIKERLNLFRLMCGKLSSISRQAFSKLRAKFDHSPLKKMFHAIVDHMYNGNHSLKTFKGYALLAVDGTYIKLLTGSSLDERYNGKGHKDNISMGMSVIHDVLNNIVVDFTTADGNMNERKEFIQQLDTVIEKYPLQLANSIITADRGYPSSDIFKILHDKGLKFVIRCTNSFSNAITNCPLGFTTITDDTGVEIRILKFIGKNNQIITLATNLMDFSEDELKQIYKLRWLIETSFNTLKNKLFADRNLGRTYNSVMQDIWASMVVHNLVGIVQYEADALIESRAINAKKQQGFILSKNKKKELKHQYRTNTKYLISHLRSIYIFAGLLLDSWRYECDLSAIIETVIESKTEKIPECYSVNIVSKNFHAA